MDYLSTFSIEFSGLEAGHYTYDFNIGDKFFESFPASIVRQGDIALAVAMNRQEDLLILEMDFRGNLSLMCDRCLGVFPFPVSLRRTLLVKLKDAAEESDEDDVVIIPRTDHRFDLAVHIYDYLSLLVPYRKLHPDVNGVSGCDPAALAEIEKRSRKQHVPDERWEVLKKINIPGGKR